MRTCLALLLAVCLASPVCAAGFHGLTVKEGEKIATSVSELMGGIDVAFVLKGNILAHVAGSDDTYIFHDSTGKTAVVIDPKVLAGRDVTPRDGVVISGRIQQVADGSLRRIVNVLEIGR